jgi:hypothetical protein
MRMAMGMRIEIGGLLVRGKAWKARPVQTDLFEKRPARRFVTLDTVEYVSGSKEGGVVLVGRRGEAEVHIKVSDALVAELLARLRSRGKGHQCHVPSL